MLHRGHLRADACAPPGPCPPATMSSKRVLKALVCVLCGLDPSADYAVLPCQCTVCTGCIPELMQDGQRCPMCGGGPFTAYTRYTNKATPAREGPARKAKPSGRAALPAGPVERTTNIVLPPPPLPLPLPPPAVPTSTRMAGDGRNTMEITAPSGGDATRAPPGLAAWVGGAEQPEQRIYMSIGFTKENEQVLVEASLPTAANSATEATPAELLDFMGFLGAMLRDVYMYNESRQVSAPVVNLTDFVERAVADEAAMSRFIHALGCSDADAAKDSSHWSTDERAAKRTTCGAYLALEVLRKGVNQEKRHALQNWMAQMLEVRRHRRRHAHPPSPPPAAAATLPPQPPPPKSLAHATTDHHNRPSPLPKVGSKHDIKELLTKLSIATQRAVDVVLDADTDFDQLAPLMTDERMFRCVASLKVCDYDNCGFTRKGKNCGYEQFVSFIAPPSRSLAPIIPPTPLISA